MNEMGIKSQHTWYISGITNQFKERKNRLTILNRQNIYIRLISKLDKLFYDIYD